MLLSDFFWNKKCLITNIGLFAMYVKVDLAQKR